MKRNYEKPIVAALEADCIVLLAASSTKQINVYDDEDEEYLPSDAMCRPLSTSPFSDEDEEY